MSVTTLRYYQVHVTKYLDFWDDPLSATSATIASFMAHLTCGPGGKHAYYRAVRAFYRWLEEQEIVPTDPTRRTHAPRVPKPLRYAVPVEKLGELLEACVTVRDKLVVSLLADTGLRLSELARLRTEDVDFETCILRVWGKGAKERVGRYGPVTAHLLDAYQPASEKLLGLSANGIALVLKRLEQRTGIKCNAHAFRRTFASESVRNGLNLFYVQSLLGHSTLTMTRIYAEQVGSEDAIKAYQPIVR